MTAELPSPSEGWELVTDANRRPELIRRLREGVPEPWSDALYQAIVVDELSGAPALAAALSVAGSVAGRLVPQHRQEIFLSCITLLRQPVDPYDRSATRLATAARHAAAELLAADPALDGRAIEALATRDVPTLLPAVASALRAGRDPDAKRFERYVQALSLSREQLVRFAEDSSADNSPVQLEPHPALPTLSKRRRRWTLARAPVTDLAAFVTGPALAAGLALVGSCVDGRLTNVSADAGVAVGALAVLAAVHVLSVQLAATSLPSPVAAAAVAPTPIKVAYGIGIAALGVALLAEVDRPPFGWHPGAVAAVLVVLTTALVAFVTITTLRDLGAAPASVRAARNGAAEALRAAEVVVALRRQSRDLAAAVDGADYLRRQLSADETVERRPVVARSSGVLEVDSQALVELSRRRSWREGDLRLDVLQAPGIGVPAGTELASVVASANVVISDNDYQAAASAFRVAPQPRLRALDTLCVALVDELLALARAGDTTGARTIQAELLSLLEVHLAALREVEGAGAPAPVLLAVVSRALRALADGREDEPVHCVERAPGRGAPHRQGRWRDRTHCNAGRGGRAGIARSALSAL